MKKKFLLNYFNNVSKYLTLIKLKINQQNKSLFNIGTFIALLIEGTKVHFYSLNLSFFSF